MSQPQPLPIDDKLAAFDSIPLFMKTLPTEDTDDIAIRALQSLAYEGTPNEIARNFKEQGNEYFKGKRYREALGFYNQGVDARPTDVSLQEALLNNRAACNLELKNFGKVLRDCSTALGINARSSKAFYRSAMALLSLDRLEEAIDCCDRCLGFDKGNEDVRAALERAKTAKNVKEEKDRERIERLEKEKEAKRVMKTALLQRNITAIGEGTYAPRFDDDGTTLIIPTFFLYPQYATSDLITNFVEETTFGEQLRTMFPPNAPAPEWDEKGDYVVERLAVYVTTRDGRVLKIGKKVRLRDAVRGGVELRDGCLSFVVLPKSAEEMWLKTVRK